MHTYWKWQELILANLNLSEEPLALFILALFIKFHEKE